VCASEESLASESDDESRLWRAGRGDVASDSSGGRRGLSSDGEGGDVVMAGGPVTLKSNWHGAGWGQGGSGAAVESSGVGSESSELTVSKLSGVDPKNDPSLAQNTAAPVESSGVGSESSELTVSKLSVDEDDRTSASTSSRSEWARVYFEVLISSSRGVRNETFFWIGKRGRWTDMRLRTGLGTGPLSRMEREWAGIEYGGMVESKEKDELEEADELELWRTGEGLGLSATGVVLRERVGRGFRGVDRRS
jgi:hypothetical protein